MENYKYLTPEEEIALLEMDEASLFLVINRIKTIKKDLQLKDKRLKHYKRILFKCIWQTKRFGVTDLPAKGEIKQDLTSPMFEDWYQYYERWFNNLALEVKNKVITEHREGKNISAYIPKQKWQTISRVERTLT